MLRHFITEMKDKIILSQKAEEVCSFLKKLNINYEIVTHSPAFTLEECEKISKIINGIICKNLLLKNDSGKSIYLLMMSPDKRFVTKDVSKKLGSSRLSFASGEYMEALLNTSPGSLSITSLIFNKDKTVSLAIERSILEKDYICCHPSDNTATLKIRTADVLDIFIPSLGITPQIIDIE